MKQKIFSKALRMLISLATVSGILLSFSGCTPASSNLLVDGSNLKLEFDINTVKDPGPQPEFTTLVSFPESLSFQKCEEIFFPGREVQYQYGGISIDILPTDLPENSREYVAFQGGDSSLFQNEESGGTLQDCYIMTYSREQKGVGYDAAMGVVKATLPEKCVGPVSTTFASPSDELMEKYVKDAEHIIESLGYYKYEVAVARKYTREALEQLQKFTYTVYGRTFQYPETVYFIRFHLYDVTTGENSLGSVDFLYGADGLREVFAGPEAQKYEVSAMKTMCSPQTALKAVSAALGTHELTLHDVYATSYYADYKDGKQHYEPVWCFVFRDPKQAEVRDENDDLKKIDCWQFNYMYVNAAGEVIEISRGTVLSGGGLYPITEYNK
jgi:hypothetical protein